MPSHCDGIFYAAHPNGRQSARRRPAALRSCRQVPRDIAYCGVSVSDSPHRRARALRRAWNQVCGRLEGHGMPESAPADERSCHGHHHRRIGPRLLADAACYPRPRARTGDARPRDDAAARHPAAAALRTAQRRRRHPSAPRTHPHRPQGHTASHHGRHRRDSAQGHRPYRHHHEELPGQYRAVRRRLGKRSFRLLARARAGAPGATRLSGPHYAPHV